MQLLIDAQNDSLDQIHLAIVYLQQVMMMRKGEATPAQKDEGTKVEIARPLSEIAPDPLAPTRVREGEPVKTLDKSAATPTPPKPEKAKREPKVSKTVTQEEVRQVMITKQGEGKAAALKTVLTKFGATKISEIPLEKLAEFHDEIKVL